MPMDRKSKRYIRESTTLLKMAEIYCKDQHQDRIRQNNGLCEECAALMTYADLRLERCVFGENKPQCVKCPIHCYKPAMRKSARKLMVYSGPKMLLKHPILSIFHILDGFRKTKRKRT